MSRSHISPDEDSGPDPILIDAMFTANRIAAALERLALIASSNRFAFDGTCLGDVLSLNAEALARWCAAVNAPHLRFDTQGIRAEATEIFNDIRSRGHMDIAKLAVRARQWAKAVEGYCTLTARTAVRSSP